MNFGKHKHISAHDNNYHVYIRNACIVGEPNLYIIEVSSCVFSLQGLHTEAVRRCSICQVNVALLIFENGVKSIVFYCDFR
jgi:hypothetical protein